MDGLFDSAWMKWARAVAHAQALDADIERLALDSKTEPFGTFRHHYEPERHGFSLRVDTIKPIPARWNLMLGDAVFNYRSCLDHLAWALVQRGRTPNLTPYEESGVYFPIAKSASHLRKMLDDSGKKRSKLPGIRRADLAVVRSYQPYHRGATRVPWHCFSILDALSNGDKHREIQGVWMVPEILEFNVLSYRHCVASMVSPKAFRRVMDVGTEVAFVRVRKTGPEPDIQMEYDITCYPAFHPRLWLQHWLDVTTATINLLLAEFAEEPAEIETVGLRVDGLRRAFDTYNGHATLKRRGPFPPY